MMQHSLRFFLVFISIWTFEATGEQHKPAADRYPSVAFIGNNEWLCAWQLKYIGEKASTLSFSRSTDGGATWQEAQQPLASNQVSCGSGTRITCSDNTVSILGCKNNILSKDRGIFWETMSSDVSYKAPSRTYTRSDMVEGAEGVLGLAFCEGINHNFEQSETYTVFSHDGGKTWQEPLQLSTTPTKYKFRRYELPVLATDKMGKWLAVWYGDGCYYCRRSSDNAESWTEPEVVIEHNKEEGHEVKEPKIDISASGCCLMTWRTWTDGGDGPFGPSYVKAMRTTDAGATWEPYSILNKGQEDNFSSVDGIRTATDHKGHWVVVWQARVPANGRVPKDYDICYTTSSDDAHTWSEPKAINTNAAKDVGDDLACSIATDGDGTWLATWYSNDTLNGRLGRDDDILYARSKDNGATWSDPAPLNSDISPEVQDPDFSRNTTPYLVTDGKGCWLAVWSSWEHDREKYDRDAELLVARSEDNGRSWSNPVTANTDAAMDVFNDTTPHLAVKDDGVWMLTWLRHDNDRVRCFVAVARSTNKGKTWSQPQIVSYYDEYTADFFKNPAVAPGKEGAWAVVFSLYDLGGTHIAQVAQSSDEGLTWGKSFTLDESLGWGDVETTIVSTNKLNWLAVCISNNLAMHRSIDNKKWEPVISLPNGFSDNPSLFPGDPGYWILVSFNRDDHTQKMTAAALRISSDDGLTWTEPTMLAEDPSKPFVAAYGGGGKWIGVRSPIQYEYYEKVSPEPLYLMRSEDNGQTWTPKVPFLAGKTPVEGAGAQIVADRKGNWVLIWQSRFGKHQIKEWKIFTSYSSDNGQSWSQPSQLGERP